MGIDLESAVVAHVKWKNRLQTAIDSNSSDLDPTIICQDNKCELGYWIHGDGAKFKSKPSYEILRQKHAAFHLCAADVARKILAKDTTGAEALLHGKFSETSLDTVMAIRNLRKEVES